MSLIRTRCQGMLTIARFNWPLYLTAFIILVATFIVGFWFNQPLVKTGCLVIFAGAFYFFFGSLGVSHLIYDRSDLYRWKWLERALGNSATDRAVFCHSGFDEASESLKETLKPTTWTVLDHFDPQRMTEPSIHRARQLFPPTSATIAAKFNDWPIDTNSQDLVFGLLAIHEFRSEEERTAWFTEARRCLSKSGRIILVEHVRDLANFLAFGPGFLHFHSPASWQRCWEKAGLRLTDQFRITPWIRVFVITSND